MRKLIFLLLSAVVLSQVANADETGGINYSIDEDAKTAKVAYWQDKSLSGSVVIPSTITYEGITYPVTEIEEGAFSENENITSVTIGASVKRIGNDAFDQCKGLKSVTIGKNVTYIGEDAFADCTNLTDVTMGNSVDTIDNGAFVSCESLTSFTIPNSVTYIGFYTFNWCKNITSVTIGSSVRQIRMGAFYNCKSLKSVTCLSTTPPAVSDAFDNSTYEQGTLYVPKGSANAYKKADYSTTFTDLSETVSTRSAEAYRNADGWKNFVNIVEIDLPSAITSVKYDGNDKATAIYDIEGRKLSAPMKGINIINGKKVLVK